MAQTDFPLGGEGAGSPLPNNPTPVIGVSDLNLWLFGRRSHAETPLTALLFFNNSHTGWNAA